MSTLFLDSVYFPFLTRTRTHYRSKKIFRTQFYSKKYTQILLSFSLIFAPRQSPLAAVSYVDKQFDFSKNWITTTEDKN